MHRTGKLRTDWPARFGRGEALPRTGRARFLIYAVSVGEVNAIRQLVDRIAADADRPEVVIAAATDTGFARAREVFGARHVVVRYPFDASWMVERFLDRVQPDVVALCELEVWPNFVDACARRNIPVTVVNGRLSERSYGRYVMLKALFAPTFRKLDAVFAQNQEYAGRFLGLGAEEGRVYVTGTMKWDTAQIADAVAGADDLPRPWESIAACPSWWPDPPRPRSTGSSAKPSPRACSSCVRLESRSGSMPLPRISRAARAVRSARREALPGCFSWTPSASCARRIRWRMWW